ncbi:MAG: DUF302 domain-containing protein [Acidimicrobiia bacterium]|nr:DUF302 domain-containing protein [Acidimicrobiia bacterium]MDH5505230.1 DUF302 domain-containing protein [Acidimicrobiia bacterium]
MEAHSYGMTITTDLGMEAAETAIRSALADQGFGILTEIDVAATLKTKIDVDRSPYRILGACNPVLANQALEIEEGIGLLLPCNVAVYESNGRTVVAAMEPELMSGVTENSALADVAAEAKRRLVAALSTLES